MFERSVIAKIKEEKDRISGQDSRFCEQKEVVCVILQAVRKNVNYPIDQ